MKDFRFVESSQSLRYLNEDPPHFILCHVALFLLVLANFLVQVSLIRILHHDTTNALTVVWEGLPQGLRGFIDERLMILANIEVAYGGHNPDFIKGVFLFFLRQFPEFDLFEGVGLVVMDAAHVIHRAVRSLTYTQTQLLSLRWEAVYLAA